MKVEECTQSSKKSTIQTPKNSCGSGTSLMDNCPEPMKTTQCTHAPRNLVLLAGLSVFTISGYTLLYIAGFAELIIRPNIEYKPLNKGSDSEE
ncbi:hypothetical protein C0J52_12728 [Blattella germanica]|nr:hypothetical protein C0J52_12728 [Blattella germanica]